MKRLRAVLSARLRCRRRPFRDYEVPEQHAPGRGLQGLRVDGQEMIAKEALLLVIDLVGLQHLLPALTRHGDFAHGPPRVHAAPP